MTGFAEVSEVSEAVPGDSPATSRRNTSQLEALGEDGLQRTGSTVSAISVQSRHLSVATKVVSHGWLLLFTVDVSYQHS